jgi:hypothetical protein
LRPLHTKDKTTAKNQQAPALIHHASLVEQNNQLINDLYSALRYIPADDYHEWISGGQALKCLNYDGFELWLEWSASSNKFDRDDAIKKWNTFAGERTGYKAIFAKAQKNGWKNPASSTNQMVISNDRPKQDESKLIDSVWAEVSIVDLFSNPSVPPCFIIDSLLPL